MKKVLFFALFLVFFGTVGINAQVRIGGNAAPNAAAVLDLNALDETTNGTKGLALPRVDLGALTGTPALLDGKTPTNGMLVYNTGTTVPAGIYYWVTNTWYKLTIDGSLPTTNVITVNVSSNYTPPASVFTAQQTVIIGFGPSAVTMTLPDLTAADKGRIVTVSAQVQSGGLSVYFTTCKDTDGTSTELRTNTITNKTSWTYMWCGTFWVVMSK